MVYECLSECLPLESIPISHHLRAFDKKTQVINTYFGQPPDRLPVPITEATSRHKPDAGMHGCIEWILMVFPTSQTKALEASMTYSYLLPT